MATGWLDRLRARLTGHEPEQENAPSPWMTNPTAIIRTGPRDPGTYAEFEFPRANTHRSIARSVRHGEMVLRAWGGGQVIVDGRSTGLTTQVARQAMECLARTESTCTAVSTCHVRLVLGDETSLHFSPGRVLNGDG